ncbi:GntR family transcriptional regulator [Herbaspirillum sp. RV1423]|uniref:GntR family transcriptional regulator n=1 Tax=Herbaspirillum sp. RV1423 TaxID=1443993 RepID=UPI0004B83C94|nr:GntR family transcriptional regulator [Herbaspirillum sp. RV1423]
MHASPDPSLTPSDSVAEEPVKASLPEYVYARLREDIFEMRLLPGDQVTETEVAAYFKVSRTPVREALQRLQSDGLMQGYVRGGWEVVPMDFKRFEDLYELRTLIEVHAVTRLCAGEGKHVVDMAQIEALKADWCVPVEQRLTDGRAAAALDEAFHQTLVRATGNQEMANAFDRLTDRIRIVRRLDFVYGDCVGSTYDEHAAILAQIEARAGDEAVRLITDHIAGSHAEVNQITLHRLHSARASAATERLPYVTVRVMRSF